MPDHTPVAAHRDAEKICDEPDMRRLRWAAAILLASCMTVTPTGTAVAGPGVTLLSDTTLDSSALYFVSFDGLVNNDSFQQGAILTHAGVPVRRLVHRQPSRGGGAARADR